MSLRTAFSWYTVAAWKKPVWYVLTYGTMFDDVIARLEKKNVSVNWIDYEWIEAGLADHTPLDDVLARLQK